MLIKQGKNIICIGWHKGFAIRKYKPFSAGIMGMRHIYILGFVQIDYFKG